MERRGEEKRRSCSKDKEMGVIMRERERGEKEKERERKRQATENEGETVRNQGREGKRDGD